MTNRTPLTERFDAALAYASAAHRTQFRKGIMIPYLSHLMGVASIALENGADEDQAIAVLLHDAVEDQGGAPRLADIRTRFGDRVADIVDHCTDTDVEPKPAWRPRKEAYIDHLSSVPKDALEVSLADKTHNAGAMVADLHCHGDQLWARFNGGREGSLWYYQSLSDRFKEMLPRPGAERLARLVDEMERLST